jgi:hypothetical protein
MINKRIIGLCLSGFLMSAALAQTDVSYEAMKLKYPDSEVVFL